MTTITMFLTLIGNNFDPAYVTDRLGIKPDEIRVKNEVLGNGRIFGHYEWGICSSKYETDFAKMAIDEVLERIYDKIPLFSVVAKEVMAEWHFLFTFDVYEDFPVVVFSKEFIQIAAELDAQIGFDVLLLNK